MASISKISEKQIIFINNGVLNYNDSVKKEEDIIKEKQRKHAQQEELKEDTILTKAVNGHKRFNSEQ